MESSAALTGIRLTSSICPSRLSSPFLSPAFPPIPTSLSLKVLLFPFPSLSFSFLSIYYFTLFYSSKSSFLPLPRMFSKLLMLSDLLLLFPLGSSFIYIIFNILCFTFNLPSMTQTPETTHRH